MLLLDSLGIQGLAGDPQVGLEGPEASEVMCKPWVFFWGRGSIALVRFAQSSMTQGCSALLEFYDNFPRFPQLISWWLSGSCGFLVFSTFCSYYRNSALWNAHVYLVLSESHNSPQRRTECMSLSLLEK